MVYPYRSPGPAPQLGGGGGPLPPSYSSSVSGAGVGGGYGGFSSSPSTGPPCHAYDQPRIAPTDMYTPSYAAGGFAGAGMAPSYCQMQDYLNGGGPPLGVHPGGPGGMYPRAGASPMRPPGWGQPQYPGDGLYSRGLPGDGRFPGHGGTNPYAFHSPPTPPRERQHIEAPPVGLPVQPEGSWEILTEDNQWRPWLPGADFYGYPGEELHFRLMGFSYFVVFDSAASGTQLNLVTGIRRPIRRRAIQPGQEARDATLQDRRFAEVAAQDRLAALRADAQRTDALRADAPPNLLASSLRRLHAQHGDQPISRGTEQTRPGRSPPTSPPAEEGGIDGTAAYDLASEAYRELQKLGQGRAAPEQPDTPPVIVLGNGPAGYSAVAPGQDTSAPASPKLQESTEPDAFALLEDLKVEQQALESKVGVILEALEEEAVTPGQARDRLAQIEAKLSKLQCKGIDCVSTEGLAPEMADEVRTLRKQLTGKAENLQSRLDDLFSQIKSMLSNKSDATTL